MTNEISPDSQAILLLTIPLEDREVAPPLSQGEYNELATALNKADLRPGDLISRNKALLAKQTAKSVISEERLERVLGRQLRLATELTNWQGLDIWVVTRADDAYPTHLRKRMRAHAPAVLFGIGDVRALQQLGLGIVGSRNVNDDVAQFAADVGRLAGFAEVPVVSGGARGVDRAAMSGALEHGGRAIGFLSDSLDKQATSTETRSFIENGLLTFVSSSPPAQRFQAWRAMDRNKLIYAQSFASLVVESDIGKGGTWNGAREQLQRLRYCQLFVRETEPMSDGRSGLERIGALRWNIQSAAELRVLSQLPQEIETVLDEHSVSKQLRLDF